MTNREVESLKEIGEKRRLALLTGVPGSGKDFLLGKLSESDPRLGSSITVFNFGELMFQRLQELSQTEVSGLISRDDLSMKLDQAQVMGLIRSVIDDIIASQPAVVASHVAYKQNGSIQINPDIDRYVQFSRYIYIWSDPTEIYQRRLLSPRKREPESIDDIYIHQQIAYNATRTIAKALGAGFVLVNNRADNVGNNTDILQDVIGGI